MIKDTVKSKMIEAMKNKDKQKKEILSLIVSEITRAELNKKERLVTDARKSEAKRLNIKIDDVVLDAETVERINVEALITEQEEFEVIKKMGKSVNTVIDNLKDKAGKETELAKAQLELDIYNEFLPKNLTESEIRTIIEDVLSKLGLTDTASKKDIGTIRKELNPLVVGKSDGKLVTDILNSYLEN